MSQKEKSRFGEIRKVSKKLWLEKTSRTRYVNDNFSDSYECNWQNNYVPEGLHNSLFCSLAEWSSNITDMLVDYRFDAYEFSNPEHNKALFRFYTRVLLIVSEIMSDFQDSLMCLTNVSRDKDRDKVRKRLNMNNVPFSVEDLFHYINSVCKHKVGLLTKDGKFKYHICNHHLDYYFEDSTAERPSDLVTIDKLKSTHFSPEMCFSVPKLECIIQVVLNGYSVLNSVIVECSKKSQLRERLNKYER